MVDNITKIEEDERRHLETEERQGLVGEGARKDYPDNQNFWQYGYLDARHGMPADPYDPRGYGMSEQDVNAYYDGHQTGKNYTPPRIAVTGDGSQTDGKIVGLCPGCNRAIRKHKTMHGDELRHLHNNSVRCFGKTSSSDLHCLDCKRPLRHHEEAEFWLGHPVLTDDTTDPPHSGEICPVTDEPHRPSNAHTGGLDGPALLEAADAAGKGLNEIEDHLEKPPDLWAYRAESALQMYADYLGRPDANNPTGRGPDEYKARTWDAYQTTRPMQSVEDRGVNTPVLPAEPIKTRNINTPTTGYEDRDDRLQVTRDEDDEDED
jgi:hypothetical protein